MTTEADSEPATKGDIEILRREIGARIDGVDDKLTRRIDGVDDKLTRRIDGVDDKLTRRIDGVEARLTKRIDGVEARLTKRMDDLKVELLTEIGGSVQHSVNVVLEQFTAHVRAFDEKYQDLPARVTALEERERAR